MYFITIIILIILLVIIYLVYVGHCVFQGRLTYSIMVFYRTLSYMDINTAMDFFHNNL